MKTGRKLHELLKELERQEKEKRDYISPASSLNSESSNRGQSGRRHSTGRNSRSNSEEGMGAVSVLPLVYTLVCKNGLIVNSQGERKTHIGRSLKEYEGILSAETKAAEDKAFLLKLRDVVKVALDETVFRRVVDELERAAELPITGHVGEVVELTCHEYGMTEMEREGILKYLIEGGELSRYGLSNAVTRVSQDSESYDRATELESIGWKVITMSSRQWNEINASDHRYRVV